MSQPQPQPNWKLPLILSTVLAAGGTFVYWYQYNQKPKQEKAETDQKKPLALPSEDLQIASIRVKTDKGLVELKCDELAAKKCKVSDNGKWTVTHPRELVADHDHVKEFLGNVTSLVASETIDLREDSAEKRQKLLTEYGLDEKQRANPSIQFIELTAEDGKRYSAWFGTEHPLGSKFFVARTVDGKVQDETIYLIASYHKSNLAKDLTYFRDKTLFKFGRGDIQSFEATTSGGKLVGKKVDGLWQVNGLPGEHDRIETILTSIAKTEAREFPEPSAYKGAKTVAKYELKTEKETFKIELLAKTVKADLPSGHDDHDGHNHGSSSGSAKQYFARVNTRPEVVEVDSVLVTQIDKKLNDFRKTTLIGDTEKATASRMRVEIKGAKAPLSFELKDGAWTPADPAVKADGKKAQALLEALHAARIAEFIPTVPAPGKEELTVTLGDEKNPSKAKYRLLQIKDKIHAVDLLSKRRESFELNTAAKEAMKNALPFTEDSWKMKE